MKKKQKINPFNDFIADDTLDFHEYDMLYPYDIEKILNEFLEDSYVAGYKRVIVVTGKGRVVKPIVERLLKEIRLVANYKIAGYFNGQEGAFEVELID